MSQETTLQLLKAAGVWMTCKEIAAELDVSVSTVSTNLRKLRKGKFIVVKKFYEKRRQGVPKYKVVRGNYGSKRRDGVAVKRNKKVGNRTLHKRYVRKKSG